MAPHNNQPKNNSSIIAIASIVVGIVLIAGVVVLAVNNNSASTISSTNSSSSSQKSEDKMVKKDGEVVSNVGSYTNYSADLLKKAEDGNVVIFFKASWCTTCQALDKDIKANSDQIPSNLTILDADYDKETSLKKKYGVTTQHTLVKVDKDGNQIKKVTGLSSLAKITDFVK